MSLPPELAALPPDERDGVIALAVELVRSASEPLPWLTPQQTRLVRAVQAVAPRVAPYEVLAQIIAPSTWAGNEVRAVQQVHIVRHHIGRRDPSIYVRLRPVRCEGLRWA